MGTSHSRIATDDTRRAMRLVSCVMYRAYIRISLIPMFLSAKSDNFTSFALRYDMHSIFPYVPDVPQVPFRPSGKSAAPALICLDSGTLGPFRAQDGRHVRYLPALKARSAYGAELRAYCARTYCNVHLCVAGRAVLRMRLCLRLLDKQVRRTAHSSVHIRERICARTAVISDNCTSVRT